MWSYVLFSHTASFLHLDLLIFVDIGYKNEQVQLLTLAASIPAFVRNFTLTLVDASLFVRFALRLFSLFAIAI